MFLIEHAIHPMENNLDEAAIAYMLNADEQNGAALNYQQDDQDVLSVTSDDKKRKIDFIYEYPFDDQKCELIVASAAQLKKHKKEVCSVEHPFVCDVQDCGKTFKYKQGLSQHQSVHSSERPFVCDVQNCGKTFKYKQALLRHHSVHSNERLFVCNVQNCEETFKLKQTLSQHQAVHSTKCPFVCDIEDCKKAFKSKLGFSLHQARHTLAKKDDAAEDKDDDLI